MALRLIETEVINRNNQRETWFQVWQDGWILKYFERKEDAERFLESQSKMGGES